MSAAVVDEASVYGCTGHPTPKELKTLLEWCLNEPISVAFQSELNLVLPPPPLAVVRLNDTRLFVA